MARKGSQPKRGTDQTSSKSSKKDPELKVTTDDFLGTEQHSPPLMAGINSGSHTGDGRKKNKKSRNVIAKDEQVDGMSNGSLVNDSSLPSEDVEGVGRVDSNTPHVRNKRPKSVNGTFGHRTNRSYTANRRDKVDFYRHMALESLRNSVMSILLTSNGWLEKHQPFFISLVNKFHGVGDYIRWKVVQTYPIVLRWLFHVGNILLLVSMVWLDCAVRGTGSLLRMGTTSFLATLWFSILSVVAMIGMFKFLLVLVSCVLTWACLSAIIICEFVTAFVLVFEFAVSCTFCNSVRLLLALSHKLGCCLNPDFEHQFLYEIFSHNM